MVTATTDYTGGGGGIFLTVWYAVYVLMLIG